MLEAGLEELIVVVQEDDLHDFQSFFNAQISIENYNKLPPLFQDYARRILDNGKKVSFTVQPTQEGFGHAVYCARKMLGMEPFLLMLGDHLYRSNEDRSCAHQLLDVYQQHRISVLGLRHTPEDQIANFGTVSGVWIEEDRLLNITEFSEKPTIDYARSNLRVPGLPEGKYLTVFGQYILELKIFDYLEMHIKTNVREHGDFQLTSALDRLWREHGFLGLVMDGRRYDIGLPEHYLETLNTFPQKEIRPSGR